MCPTDHFYEHKNACLIFKKKYILFRFTAKKQTNKKQTNKGIYALFLSRTVRFFRLHRKLNFLATDWLKVS